MKTILTILFLFLITAIHAATGKTYYVSYSAGNDAYTATQAQSFATPWKTCSKLNALMNAGTIVNGDIIRFKAGDVWAQDTLTLTKGVALDSFGTGAKPLITGFYPITTWTSLGGGIYESEALTVPANLSMVALNGKPVAMGRYPNADAANGGYLSFEAHGSGYIRDVTGKPAAISNANYNGAQVFIRASHFVIDRATISLINGDTIKYTASTTPTDSYGYFIENSINTLDQLGEWYYNPSTKKLAMYFPSGPAGYTVQVATKNNLCEPRVNNTSISNINFIGANQYCLYNNWGGVSGLTVTNCSFKQAGSACFGLTGRAGLVLDRDTFDYGLNLGLSLTFHNDRAKVINCYTDHSGPYVGMYWKDNNIAGRYGNGITSLTQAWDGSYFGITVLNSTVKNSGYMGIFCSGDSNIIKYNYIDTACTQLDDGGGIYHGNLEIYANKYEVIDSNQVFHVLGNHYGTGSNTIDQGEGIYPDDGSRNVFIRGNTCAYNGNSGIYLHNARKYTIMYNNIYNNGGRQIGFQHDHVVNVANMDSGVVKKNVLFAQNSSQKLLYFGKDSSYHEQYYTYASFDSNYYCSPFTLSGGAEQNIVQTNWFLKGQVFNYSLAGWRTYSSMDTHTTATPLPITDPAKIVFKYNSSLSVSKDYRFCSACVGVDGSTLLKKTTVGPTQSVILLKP